MHPLRHGKRLLPALDSTGPRDYRQPGSTDRSLSAGETNHRVVFFDIAANQLVGLRNLDDFLHARHLFERALLHLPLIPGDADSSPLRSRHSMRPVTQRLNLRANRAHLFLSSVRLHHYQHKFLSSRTNTNHVGTAASAVRSSAAKPAAP